MLAPTHEPADLLELLQHALLRRRSDAPLPMVDGRPATLSAATAAVATCTPGLIALEPALSLLRKRIVDSAFDNLLGQRLFWPLVRGSMLQLTALPLPLAGRADWVHGARLLAAVPELRPPAAVASAMQPHASERSFGGSSGAVDAGEDAGGGDGFDDSAVEAAAAAATSGAWQRRRRLSIWRRRR